MKRNRPFTERSYDDPSENPSRTKRVKRDAGYVSAHDSERSDESATESDADTCLYDNDTKYAILQGYGCDIPYTEQAAQLVHFLVQPEHTVISLACPGRSWQPYTEATSAQQARTRHVIKMVLAIYIEDEGPLLIPCLYQLTNPGLGSHNTLYDLVFKLLHGICGLLQIGGILMQIKKFEGQESQLYYNQALDKDDHDSPSVKDDQNQEEEKGSGQETNSASLRQDTTHHCDELYLGWTMEMQDGPVKEADHLLQDELIKHMSLHSIQQSQVVQLLNMLDMHIQVEKEEQQLQQSDKSDSDESIALFKPLWETTDHQAIQQRLAYFTTLVQNCRASTHPAKAIKQLALNQTAPALQQGSNDVYEHNINTCYTLLREYILIFPMYAHLYEDKDDLTQHNKMWNPWACLQLIHFSEGDQQNGQPPFVQQPYQDTYMALFTEACKDLHEEKQT